MIPMETGYGLGRTLRQKHDARSFPGSLPSPWSPGREPARSLSARAILFGVRVRAGELGSVSWFSSESNGNLAERYPLQLRREPRKTRSVRLGFSFRTSSPRPDFFHGGRFQSFSAGPGRTRSTLLLALPRHFPPYLVAMDRRLRDSICGTCGGSASSPGLANPGSAYRPRIRFRNSYVWAFAQRAAVPIS